MRLHNTLQRFEQGTLEARAYTSLSRLLEARHWGMFNGGRRVPYSNQQEQGLSRSAKSGRGTDFLELQPYQPGDDVRHMDWKATARVGAPWLRAFEQERQRHCSVIVDQRSCLFFGSMAYTKSLLAAELAAITAWDHLLLGYSVRLVILSDEQVDEGDVLYSVERLSERLGLLARCNQQLGAWHSQSYSGSIAEAIEKTHRLPRHEMFWFTSALNWRVPDRTSLATVLEKHRFTCISVEDVAELDPQRIAACDWVGPSSESLALDRSSEYYATLAARAQASITAFDVLCRTFHGALYRVDSGNSASAAYHEQAGFGRFLSDQSDVSRA